MQEGYQAKEGNIKLLRKKEPTKPGRNILDRYPETKAWSLPCVQNRAIVKRLAGCLFSLSSLIGLSFQTLICEAEGGSLQVTATVQRPFGQVAFARFCQ